MADYSYKRLIDRYLDWNRVEARLRIYPHIRRVFDIDFLKTHSESPPCYSHYLAWRLGIWNREDIFRHLDHLLEVAISLPGWGDSKCTNYSPEYENFFSLLWELQIAKFLATQSGLSIEWLPEGPDFRVIVDNQPFYVECFVYRKSFGIELFIEDLLMRMHNSIKVKHASCMVFSLPHNQNLPQFLEELLSPFLNDKYLVELVESGRQKWPVVIPVPENAQNFYVYINGEESRDFDIETPVPFSTGDMEAYLAHSIREAVNNKRNSNKLTQHRPNILAINFLLSQDYQQAVEHSSYVGQTLPRADYGSEFDGFIFAACGIDSTPTIENIKVQLNHVPLDFLWKLVGTYRAGQTTGIQGHFQLSPLPNIRCT
jgi:hypothetical protein